MRSHRACPTSSSPRSPRSSPRRLVFGSAVTRTRGCGRPIGRAWRRHLDPAQFQARPSGKRKACLFLVEQELLRIEGESMLGPAMQGTLAHAGETAPRLFQQGRRILDHHPCPRRKVVEERAETGMKDGSERLRCRKNPRRARSAPAGSGSCLTGRRLGRLRPASATGCRLLRLPRFPAPGGAPLGRPAARCAGWRRRTGGVTPPRRQRARCVPGACRPGEKRR